MHAAGQQRCGSRIGEHERQPLRWVRRIERDVCAAGLEDAETRDDHVERALHADGDERVRPDTEGAQTMRDPVGTAVQLAVCELPFFIEERHCLRRALDLGFEDLRHRARRIYARRVVPFHEEAVALGRREDRQGGEPAVGVGGHPLQQRAVVSRKPLDPLRLEEVAPVVDARPQRPVTQVVDEESEIERR